VYPKASEIGMNVSNLCTSIRDIYKELAVPAGAVLKVESWRPAVSISPKECRLLEPLRSPIEEVRHREISRLIMPDPLSATVYLESIAHGHVAFRMRRKKIRDTLQGTGVKQIVSVEKAIDITCRASKPFIQPVCSSAVRFQDDLCNPVSIAFNQFPASVL
jgi:hypothetical protein